MISIICANCGKQYNVKDEIVGKRVRCRECGEAIAVPVPMEPVIAEEEGPTGGDSQTPPKRGKNRDVLIVLTFTGLCIIAVGAGGWWLWKQGPTRPPIDVATSQSNRSNLSIADFSGKWEGPGVSLSLDGGGSGLGVFHLHQGGDLVQTSFSRIQIRGKDDGFFISALDTDFKLVLSTDRNTLELIEIRDRLRVKCLRQ